MDNEKIINEETFLALQHCVKTEIVNRIIDFKNNFFYYEVKASVYLSNGAFFMDGHGVASSKDDNTNDFNSLISIATSKAIAEAEKRIHTYSTEKKKKKN